jgi:hypothetical protein
VFPPWLCAYQPAEDGSPFPLASSPDKAGEIFVNAHVLRASAGLPIAFRTSKDAVLIRSQPNHPDLDHLGAYGCEQGNGSTQGLKISKLRLEPFPKGDGSFFDLPRDHPILDAEICLGGKSFLARTHGTVCRINALA